MLLHNTVLNCVKTVIKMLNYIHPGLLKSALSDRHLKLGQNRGVQIKNSTLLLLIWVT